MQRIPVDLSDVSETSLGNLGRRAAATRMHGSVLDDPRAVEVAENLDYNYADASRGVQWRAIRVATFEAAGQPFLARHPAGTVVALGVVKPW